MNAEDKFMRVATRMQPLRGGGFTLIETAVVLLIIGLLLGGLFTSLGQSAENTRRIDSLAQLRNVEEALYGFAQANGRLPCPATAASAGVEDPAGGGNCTDAHAFVPALSLGLQGNVDALGLLLDPWGNPVLYSVSDLDVPPRAFTNAAGLRWVFNNGPLVAGLDLISICSESTCAGLTLANTVPALVFSTGPNFAISAAANETENSDGDNTFVSTGYSEENFDDQLIWLSPNVLFTRLISAGQLP